MSKTVNTLISKKANSPFNYKQLAKDVAAKRTTEGMSLREFGRTTEIALSSVYKVEAGASALDMHTIIQVCNWLAVPVQHYLTAKPAKRANKNKG
jgi:transcriptional regulator with XRE-family HTH domain